MPKDRFARGVEKLEDASIPVRGTTKFYQPGTLMGETNYLVVQDKPGGVVPGFIAIDLMELASWATSQDTPENMPKGLPLPSHLNQGKQAQYDPDKHYPLQQVASVPAGLEVREQAPTVDELREDPEEYLKRLRQFVVKNNPKAGTTEEMIKIAQEINEKAINDQFISRQIFKSDYNDPKPIPGFRGVTIPMYRASSAKGVREPGKLKKKLIPKKVRAFFYSQYKRATTNTRDENMNNVMENLGNDLARVHGMDVQDQYLMRGTYKSGKLKIVHSADMAEDLVDFKKLVTPDKDGKQSHQLVLASGSDKYRYGSIVAVKKNGELVSEPLADDLGEHYAFMVLQGGRDTLGSELQNKGLRKSTGRVFGYDFGGAFPHVHPLLDTLNDDFSFKQTKVQSKIFKNFSIMDDIPLAEKMKGMHYIRKIVTGNNPPDEVMIQYGEDFQNKINAIEGGEHVKVFDQYLKTFLELHEQAKVSGDKKLAREYLDIHTHIREAKNQYINYYRDMLKVFEKRLDLTPKELTLLENLERLTSSNSTLRTPDKKKHKGVLLNHIRVDRKKRVPWQLEKEDGKYRLVCEGKGKHKKIKTLVEEHCENYHEQKVPIKLIKNEQGQLCIEFNRGELKKVLELFDEELLKAQYHKPDYDAYCNATGKRPKTQYQSIQQVLSQSQREDALASERPGLANPPGDNYGPIPGRPVIYDKSMPLNPNEEEQAAVQPSPPSPRQIVADEQPKQLPGAQPAKQPASASKPVVSSESVTSPYQSISKSLEAKEEKRFSAEEVQRHVRAHGAKRSKKLRKEMEEIQKKIDKAKLEEARQKAEQETRKRKRSQLDDQNDDKHKRTLQSEHWQSFEVDEQNKEIKLVETPEAVAQTHHGPTHDNWLDLVKQWYLSEYKGKKPIKSYDKEDYCVIPSFEKDKYDANIKVEAGRVEFKKPIANSLKYQEKALEISTQKAIRCLAIQQYGEQVVDMNDKQFKKFLDKLDKPFEVTINNQDPKRLKLMEKVCKDYHVAVTQPRPRLAP